MRIAGRLCLLLALAAAVRVPVRGLSPQRLSHPLPTLVTAHQVHSLSSGEAARSYPVHFRAVVTYYDPYIDARHGALFVHDSTGCIFVVVPARPILPLKPGSEIDVTGVSGPGDYSPVVDRGKVALVGQSHLPLNAPIVDLPQLLSGRVDVQWVEVEGRVHQVHLSRTNVALEIATVQGPITAISVREPGADYDSLVDASVRLRGNEAGVFNQRRQMVGAHLFFPSLQQVTVVRPAPPHPFAMPVTAISQLLRFSRSELLLQRVHVQGRVTLRWPNRTLCIQQGTDSLCMQSADGPEAAVGDLIDVLGFPAVKGFKPTLENASFRTGGSALPAKAKLVTAAEIFDGDYDSQLIRIDAVLIGRDLTVGDPTLMLRSGDVLFPAVLPKGIGGGKFSWKDGSLLRLTGICIVNVDSMATGVNEGQVRPNSIKLLLNSADDVEVLHEPSWWTSERALQVFALSGLMALAGLAWIFVLRRQVEQQTEALRQSREKLRHLSEHDALTGLPNRLLLNDRLQVSIRRAERFDSCLGLLIIDVDEFKQINDALGHLAGDKVLCQVASRLTASVRATDTVARLGGDEFVVLLPDLHIPAEAETIAAGIVSDVSAPMEIGKVSSVVTVSVGVSVYPECGADAESLMHAADVALYRAKNRGRNGFQVYRSGMKSAVEAATTHKSSSQMALPILES